MSDYIGDRMKEYEHCFKYKLPSHLPIILRLDGRAFHSLTKHADKPFDADIEQLMSETALALCQQVSTVQLAYVQSDEVSLLLHPYKKITSQAWFDNNLQKMVSISAAIATATFNQLANDEIETCLHYQDTADLFALKRATSFEKKFGSKLPALFDSRAFVLPECEVVNYFIWRQQDATRNSISMLAQSLYSHKELHGKNSKDKQEMTFQKGKNWNDLPTSRKRGRCAIKMETTENGQAYRRKWVIDNEIPIFTQDRDYIQKFVGHQEEE